MKHVSFVLGLYAYRGSRDLDEAVVEAETVPDGVLPSLLVLAVVRKQVDDQLVDLAQRAHLHAPTFRSQTTLLKNFRSKTPKLVVHELHPFLVIRFTS